MRKRLYPTVGLIVFEIVNDPVVCVELTAADKSTQVVPLSRLPCNLMVLLVLLEMAQLTNSIFTPLITTGPTTFGVILKMSLFTQLILGLKAEKVLALLSRALLGRLLL